jgi:hypothetical protein
MASANSATTSFTQNTNIRCSSVVEKGTSPMTARNLAIHTREKVPQITQKKISGKVGKERTCVMTRVLQILQLIPSFKRGPRKCRKETHE